MNTSSPKRKPQPKPRATTGLGEAARAIERPALAAPTPPPPIGPPPPTAPNLLTAKQLAERLQVNIATVRRGVDSGEIPFIPLGRMHRFDYGEVIAKLRARRRGDQ